MGQVVDYQTELLKPDKFRLYWPRISEQLDTVPHIWSPWFTKDAIWTGSISGEFDVWCVGPPEDVRLVVFTRIVNYDAAKVFQLCFAFGNDLEKCLPSLMATLEAFANATNCVRCELVGRRGWKKFLPGFEETAVVLSRNLEHFKVQ